MIASWDSISIAMSDKLVVCIVQKCLHGCRATNKQKRRSSSVMNLRKLLKNLVDSKHILNKISYVCVYYSNLLLAFLEFTSKI